MNSKKSSRTPGRRGWRRSANIGVAVLAIVMVASSLGVLYFSGFWNRDATRYGPDSGQALVVPISQPTRGGPFVLADPEGNTVTDMDFRGRLMLVFFGYTYCPDVCPTELSTMALALDILGPAGEAVQPIFISVDPERDAGEPMADYAAAFHPRMIGLTGTPEQVAAVAKVYHAVYMKVPLPSDESNGDDYGVAHSASIYLVGPDGRMLSVFPRNLPPEDMAAGIRPFLKASG